MDALGWDSCDIIIVTADAYVDHPSFGMAVVGRVLEAQGYRVGIISQPNWSSAEAFKQLGQPNLFFGVTAGNMDSLINRFTADLRKRSDDAYTPGGIAGKRPDRSVIVYSQRCREAYYDTPIVIGGIEASLRRIAQYDYWSDAVRRSILIDSNANILLYGNSERALIELAHRVAAGESIEDLWQLRGSAIVKKELPAHWTEIDSTRIDWPAKIDQIPNPYDFHKTPATQQQESSTGVTKPLASTIRIIPLATDEMDWVFDLPYQRRPHPSYGDARIPAYDMIKTSVNIMRGCFGGCTFCSITEHEGRIIQSRSEASVLREIEKIRDQVPSFTGTISDLGGRRAIKNMLNCTSPKIQKTCKRLSCVYPNICQHLKTDHSATTQLYKKARAIPGIKRVAIAPGLRYDLALKDSEYIEELVTHHVGGYLKIAPEHSEHKTLSKMMKPDISSYDEFKRLFDQFSRKAGKEQYLIPYFIAAHPGCDEEDMLNLSLWIKQKNFKPDQVQTFYPSPMSLATAMYYSERNPLQKVRYKSEKLSVCKDLEQRRLQKAFLRVHDEKNWQMLRQALHKLGRSDLIGDSDRHLIPSAGEKRGQKYKQRTGKKKNNRRGK